MKRTVTIDVEPTPEELAVALACMGGDQQARFFSALALQDIEWDNSWPFQLQAVTDSADLTDDGRRFMELIGEYGPREPAPATPEES